MFKGNKFHFAIASLVGFFPDFYGGIEGDGSVCWNREEDVVESDRLRSCPYMIGSIEVLSPGSVLDEGL